MCDTCPFTRIDDAVLVILLMTLCITHSLTKLRRLCLLQSNTHLLHDNLSFLVFLVLDLLIRESTVGEILTRDSSSQHFASIMPVSQHSRLMFMTSNKTREIDYVVNI